jgi:L-lysine 2,3-aminomutase
MRNRSSISARPLAFRRRYSPDASIREWNGWRRQVRNSFKDLGQLERILQLSLHEGAALQAGRHLPTQVTPYYASLRDLGMQTRIRWTLQPVEDPFVVAGQDDIDDDRGRVEGRCTARKIGSRIQ